MSDRIRSVVRRLVPVVLCAVLALPVHAQSAGRAFSLFLDCREMFCEPDFYRTEIAFVDHVRDRGAADVHVLVTRQSTGGGGEAFTLAFYGQQRFAGVSDTVEVAIPQGSTEDETRQALARTLHLGLARYLLRTPDGSRARLTLVAPASTAPRASATRDPWNAWVFTVSADMQAARERSSSENEIDADLRANRVTERWKTRFRLGEDYTDESYDFDGERVTVVRRDYGASLLQVRSLGAHWSAGLRIGGSSSTFRNQQLGAQIAPAIEYDVYPYDQSTRRQLFIQYAAGMRHFRYTDTTVFFKKQETLPFESLTLSFEQKQTWGSLEANVSGYHFLHDLGKSRINFNAGASIRIIKGLNFNFNGSYSVIHDQLYLPKGDLTREEVLLRQTQLQTGYRARFHTGLSYTFGSVLNNVVNPRFSVGNDF